MAARPPDPILDPDGSVLLNLISEEPVKKKRRIFSTELERKQAHADGVRKSAQSRITIGNHWEEWERQRMLCGIKDTKEFVAHLLAVHAARCPQLGQVTASLLAVSGDSDFTEIVPETPTTKRKMEHADDLYDSPIIPVYKKRKTMQQSPHSTPKPVTNARRELICSTPGLDNTTESVTPEDEVTCLTPIKEQKSGRSKRLAADKDLPHSPKLFADDASDEDPAEEFADDATNFAPSDEDRDDEPMQMPKTNWRNLRVTMGTNEAIEAGKCIAFNGVIQRLLMVAVGTHCHKKDCGKELTFRERKRGTALLIIWECPGKAENTRHSSGVWSSQPRVHGMDGGTLLASTALILSGNNFAKIALMARFMKLNFMTQQQHNYIQSRYIAPAVEKHWAEMQESLLKESTAPLILAGDGRSDSPGHCATLLTYTLLDIIRKKILALSVVDCVETDLNSVVMERVGFQRAMEQVLGNAVIAEIVTDAHPQIRKLMRTDPRYSRILHQWDLWHIARNIASKLLAAGKERGMSDIIPWIPAIKNHLWFAARECGGDADKLRMLWQTVLYHVSDMHEWLDTTGLTAGRCQHKLPLPEGERVKAWIKPGTKVQQKLIEVIRNKIFVTNLSYLRKFRHTGELEQFHSSLLMYCPKRIAFPRVYYRMRCLLAAIDFNAHSERPVQEDKKGKPMERYYWSKGSKRWSSTPAKVPKRYLYINELMARVLGIRESEAAQGIHLATPMFRTPRKRRNIASVPRPSNAEISAQRKSRF